MNRQITDYAYQAKLNLPYERAIEKVTTALKEEGFSVLTEVDIQANIKKKLDADFRRYVILGACNPPLAHRALTTQVDIGLLLPCNVIVYEEDCGSVASTLNPILMLDVMDNPELSPVAEEARSRLRRVHAALVG